MTPEQLLIPRIKMIAPIPKIFSCGIEVGQTWEGEKFGNKIYFNLTSAHSIDLIAIKKYPHLFKVMDWWEERKTDDLPMYVHCEFKVYKILRWSNNHGYVIENKVTGYSFAVNLIIDELLPATEAEYNKFLEDDKNNFDELI